VTQMDQSDAEVDPFAMYDPGPSWWMSTYGPRFVAQMNPMGAYVEVRIEVDGRYIATGVGRTLGEAIMTAGALMTGTQLMPMHMRVLRWLRRHR
jgi:hypothetical protein